MFDIENKYGTYDRQVELLEMMSEIHKYFVENGIEYSLCGGTLLGAVREKGFIQWDDDIDLMVNRENLNKILKIFEEHPNNDYILKDYLWVRRIQRKDCCMDGIMVPTIDIFVMDPVPNSKLLQRIKLLLIKILQGMMKKDVDYKKYKFVHKVCIFITSTIGLFFSDRFKLRLYDCISQIGNETKADFLGVYNDLFKYLPLKYSNKMFEQYSVVEFEDSEFLITKEYDNYLSVVYGDYMTPPQLEDRVPSHIL